MFFKSVFGKLLGVLFHDVIAADLGDNAGGGDGERVGIAFDDALVREGKLLERQTINEAMVDRDTVFFCSASAAAAMESWVARRIFLASTSAASAKT